MSSAPSPLAYICHGRTCVGFILARGKLGFEAIDRDENSLGMFASQRAAASAIFQKMPGREGPGKLKVNVHDAFGSAETPAQEF